MMRDPMFPTLGSALNPQSAASAFADALAAHGFPTSGLRSTVERVRLKPCRKAVIGYSLNGRDGSGRPIEQRLMLSLYPGGEPSALPEIDGQADLTPPAFGPAALSVERLGGRAWLFPNDRKVRHIAQLLACRGQPGDIVHYVPEQGCTVRVARPGEPALYGKCRSDDRGAVAALVHAEADRCREAPRLARIVAHDPLRRILWQQEVAGGPVEIARLLANPVQWAGRIAEALARFHGLPAPPGLKQLTIAGISDVVLRRAIATGKAMPLHADRIERLLGRLAATGPDDREPALAHCDLHPANLLWDGQSFAIIDLDTAAIAPRGLDHGGLAAALVHKALEADASDERIGAMLMALRSASAAELSDRRAFDWFTAAALVAQRLYRCGTRLKTPSPFLRERLLAYAEALAFGRGRA